MTEKAYLEDVQVGQRFVSGTHTIDASQIVKFAREFDPQPFHLDEAAGAKSLFKGLVASGWHTGAITMRLLVEGELQIAGGMIGGGGELTWPNPTRPGDVLQVHSEVVAITPSRSKPDRGTITLRSETRNQRGEVLQIGQIVRRPGDGRTPEFPPPTIVEYHPRSTLVVPAHLVPRAKFPVVDLHGHPPALLSTDIVNRSARRWTRSICRSWSTRPRARAIAWRSRSRR